MTDAESARLGAAEAAVAEIRAVLPDLTAAVHAQSAQSGSQTAAAIAVDRELARLARAIDGPPSQAERIARLEAQREMSAHRESDRDADGWQDNAERGFATLMGSTPGRIATACLFVFVLGAVVVAGILAWKGDLDDVVKGAMTPGADVVDVAPGATLKADSLNALR